MAVDIAIELLDDWTESDQYDAYQRCPFKANFFQTRELLSFELERVGATDVVLWTQHSPDQLLKSGWPRVDRAPKYGPGVILEFKKLIEDTGTYEKLRFPCRTFSNWEDNVRAIALALEALRKIDRYGVTTGAQYAGYKALPAASIQSEMTPELAADFIARSAGMGEVPAVVSSILQTPVFAESVYRTAAKALHPDRESGSTEQFQKLEAAWRIVKSKHEETENNV